MTQSTTRSPGVTADAADAAAKRAPTVAQVLAEQKPPETTDRMGNRHALVARSPAAPLPAAAPVQSQMLVGERSDEAFNKHLQDLGGSGNPILISNLSDGNHKSGGEAVETAGVSYILHADEARKERIHFHGEGVPPTRISVCIYEDAELPPREELGELDQSLWELDRYNGQPIDPWLSQVVVPIISTAPDGTIYELTARSPTAMFAMRNLLDRYHRHPQRKKGLVPLITVGVSTYDNKKLGRKMYKPAYQIVGWVQKDGTAPPTSNKVTTGALDDKLPF